MHRFERARFVELSTHLTEKIDKRKKAELWECLVMLNLVRDKQP